MDLSPTQQVLAEGWGVRVENLASWERGLRKPSVPEWPRILALLGEDTEPGDGSLLARLVAARRRIRRRDWGLPYAPGCADEPSVEGWRVTVGRGGARPVGLKRGSTAAGVGRPCEIQWTTKSFPATDWLPATNR